MMRAAALLQPWCGEMPAGLALADLQLDSRRVCSGDAFFALSSDAALQAHVTQAEVQGAALVVVEQGRPVQARCPVVAVENLHSRLGEIASSFYGEPSRACKVIGITGTNGKTSCSHWLAQAWQQLAGPAGVIGTLGCGLVAGTARHDTGLTTPDVLSNHRLLADMVGQGAVMVAMEVSSHALEQGRVDGIAFDTAIFSNLSRDHLDYHGDMQSYAAAKQKLFERGELQLSVINLDDDFGKALCNLTRSGSHRLLTYAVQDKTADLGVERFDVTGRGIAASIRTPWGRGELQSRFPGGYNLLNILAVAATLCAHGMSLQTVLGAVTQLQAVPGRTQIVSGDDDDILVVVDYAHTPDALAKILAALREQVQQHQLWCVFGCGGNRDRGKRPEMAEVAVAGADAVIVTSDNPRDESPESIIADIIAGFAGRAHRVIQDRAAAIAAAIGEARRGDIVLIAGKGHEDYQEVAGRRLPFSDSAEARQALAQRRSAGVAA